MPAWDTRRFTDERREQLASRAQGYIDFALPRLKHWNYDLCREHRDGWVEQFWDDAAGADTERTVYDRPKPGCRKCGIMFRQHQRVSIMWLYLKKRALLADTMGSGKTVSAAGLVAMLAETGELPDVGRVIITPRAAALPQWYDELQRMIPTVPIAMASGTKKQRMETYLSDWGVLLIGPEMLLRDYEMLTRFPLAALITDDIDTLRNPDTAQSLHLDRLGRSADRYVIMTGTPLQKRLPELHAVLDGIGGERVLGGRDTFMQRHVRYAMVTDSDRYGREFKRNQVVGYKNLDLVKSAIAPMVMRRTAADLRDVTLPTIVTDDVFLDLYPAQRAKYRELQEGVITLLREQGTEIKHVTALSRLHYGAAICGGLATLGEPDAPHTSMKMDWIVSKVQDGGDLGAEKVVLFANYKTSVRALQTRFQQAGVGFVTVWGEENSKTARRAAQEQFWEDPGTRVLIGTKAIEQSLNLQVSRHLINMDTILNQARMNQLAGRIRRDGSPHSTVFVHNLLTIGTQEERYLPMLEREAALAGHIWDENSELFNALSATALLELISG